VVITDISVSGTARARSAKQKRLLLEDFVILEKLGSGTYGSVYAVAKKGELD